jgi:hypothetical protein
MTEQPKPVVILLSPVERQMLSGLVLAGWRVEEFGDEHNPAAWVAWNAWPHVTDGLIRFADGRAVAYRLLVQQLRWRGEPFGDPIGDHAVWLAEGDVRHCFYALLALPHAEIVTPLNTQPRRLPDEYRLPPDVTGNRRLWTP